MRPVQGMTVWTHITLEEADEWLSVRGFGRAASVFPIEEGSEDSVYRIGLKDGKTLFMRVFERTEAEGPSQLAYILTSCGLPACGPLKDSAGWFLSELKNKPAAVYPWVEGRWTPSPSLNQIYAIGEFLGRMGRIGMESCSGWRRENPRGWNWFRETAEKLCPVLDADESRELEEETRLHLSHWQAPETKSLPHGPVHADLFRDNVIWDSSSGLAAVIDWGFCASGWPLLYDLAIAANDWCLKEGSFELDADKLDALLRGREDALPMSNAERKAWPMALRLAALRFYLSRLHDKKFPRGGKELDPNHFLCILRSRTKTAGI